MTAAISNRQSYQIFAIYESTNNMWITSSSRRTASTKFSNVATFISRDNAEKAIKKIKSRLASPARCAPARMYIDAVLQTVDVANLKFDLVPLNVTAG
jgi:hypothetical protein